MSLLFRNETIVALATPVGRSAIGVVRMSGPDAFGILAKVFRPFPGTLKRAIYHGFLYDEQGDFDEVLAYCFPGPHSYTGEDVVEFSCHGNPVILDRVVKLLLEKGAGFASPGEFTLRAFLNNKIDLVQAEAINKVINAGSVLEARSEVMSLKGQYSDKILSWQRQLHNILAKTEAFIEFPEDIGEINITKEVENLCIEVELVLENSRALEKAISVNTIFIVGRPNVGKSSLFNAILGSERSLVHHQECTTRDMVCENIEITGRPVKLCDTAGIIKGKKGVDAIAIDRVLRDLGRVDIAIFVVEAGVACSMEEQQLFEEIRRQVGRLIVFVNKIDKTGSLCGMDFFKQADVVTGSAKTGEGVETLIRRIADELPEFLSGGAYLLSIRQYSVMQDVLNNLRQANSFYKTGAYDISAEAIRNAHNALASILGAEEEDVLGSIFSNFCIGK